MFDGTQLQTNAYTVEFKKQYGMDEEQEVSSSVGENVVNGSLEVSSNRLAGQSSKLLTYIINVSYTEPKTKTTLKTSARITFTLMDNPGSVKYVSITGENVFLYNFSLIFAVFVEKNGKPGFIPDKPLCDFSLIMPGEN